MKNWCNKILGIVFLCYIGINAFANRSILTESVFKTWNEEGSFQDFVETMEEKSLSDFHNKENYIELNGLFVKCMGEITNNEVVILNNGMLTDKIIKRLDITTNSNSVVQLNNYLAEREIPFLYVQAPFKVDLDGAVLPAGAINYANDNADRMVEALEKDQVRVLDLRPYLSRDESSVNTYFYKTDHHWNAYGSFRAFQLISNNLQDIFPKQRIVGVAQNQDMWEEHIKEDWFLGSHGKRVGTYFAGVDDLVWLTPKFETSMSCSIQGKESYTGDFETVNVRKKFISETDPDYFENNPYCLYIGGDYGFVGHENQLADSDLSVLLIKDSYSLPVQAYFSTVFKTLDVIDLRYYKEETLVEYIEREQPDVVFMMYYPKSFEVEKFFTFGLE